jgi:arsenate reductase (thioredoxin)
MVILFLCVANSARSQIAEALARSIFKDLASVESAGSQPTQINPYAIRVLREIGIDASKQYSKSIEDLSPGYVSSIDYVITLCAEEVCSVLPSKAKRLHWPLPDPAGKEGTEQEQLQRFRTIRDELGKRLREFVSQLERAS